MNVSNASIDIENMKPDTYIVGVDAPSGSVEHFHALALFQRRGHLAFQLMLADDARRRH